MGPESEWGFIVRGKKGFFKPREKPEVGVISRETFNESLDGHIEPFHFPRHQCGLFGSIR